VDEIMLPKYETVICESCGTSNHLNNKKHAARPKWCQGCRAVIKEPLVNPNPLWERIKQSRKKIKDVPPGTPIMTPFEFMSRLLGMGQQRSGFRRPRPQRSPWDVKLYNEPDAVVTAPKKEEDEDE
jgi:hypothetical protein